MPAISPPSLDATNVRGGSRKGVQSLEVKVRTFEAGVTTVDVRKFLSTETQEIAAAPS